MTDKVTSIPIIAIDGNWQANNEEFVNNWVNTGGAAGTSVSAGGRYTPGKASPKRLQTQSTKDVNEPALPPRKPLVSSWGSKASLKPPSLPSKAADSLYDSISEEDITIPPDGCLYGFTTDQMANFFKHLKVEDRIISFMHKKGVDGKKFARLKDSEMDNLGLNNPVIRHFKDRSQRKKSGFML